MKRENRIEANEAVMGLLKSFRCYRESDEGWRLTAGSRCSRGQAWKLWYTAKEQGLEAGEVKGFNGFSKDTFNAAVCCIAGMTDSAEQHMLLKSSLPKSLFRFPHINVKISIHCWESRQVVVLKAGEFQ